MRKERKREEKNLNCVARENPFKNEDKMKIFSAERRLREFVDYRFAQQSMLKEVCQAEDNK